MSLFQINVSTDDNAAQVSDQLAPAVTINGSAPDVWAWLRNVANYFDSASVGSKNVAVTFADTMVQASGTLTVATGGSSDGQACTVCNVTLTAKTSGADPTAGEFNISATAATQAASMVTAINTVSTLTNKVTATNNLGVVTIVSVVPGIVGNGLQLSAGDLSNVTAGAFANGAQSHTATLHGGK